MFKLATIRFKVRREGTTNKINETPSSPLSLLKALAVVLMFIGQMGKLDLIIFKICQFFAFYKWIFKKNYIDIFGVCIFDSRPSLGWGRTQILGLFGSAVLTFIVYKLPTNKRTEKPNIYIKDWDHILHISGMRFGKWVFFFKLTCFLCVKDAV